MVLVRNPENVPSVGRRCNRAGEAALSQAAHDLLPLFPGGPEAGAGDGPPAIRGIRGEPRQGLGCLPRRSDDGCRLAEICQGEVRCAPRGPAEATGGEAWVEGSFTRD